ncbi:type II secretion system F family protein [Arthrobacter sp. 35W]|uniref:type II secretion system F family protein n=1 Tax=Arthrobacter sp. 35W TaxID=1132441 RepID=UPI000406A7AC|nr:type II secretion system F family protein [Arthrobacter sp. 35W]
MNALLIFAALALAAALLLHPGRAARFRSLPARPQPARPQPADHATAETGEGIDDLSLILELLGAAMEAGLSVPRALELVAASCSPRLRDGLASVVAGLAMGASWEHSWQQVERDGDLGALFRALAFAAATGAPSAALLYAQAHQLRREARRAAEVRAAALGVRLVVPLGLCSLPAFIALGVVPVVVAMIPAMP